jgi:uncharacterized protein YciI
MMMKKVTEQLKKKSNHLTYITLKIYGNDMFYLIYSEDVENSLALRMSVREQHLARLRELQDQGRLLVAGPCPAIDNENPGDAGFTGSLIVAEFESLTQAQVWADKDPYIDAGVYKKVTVKPYKKVLPA